MTRSTNMEHVEVLRDLSEVCRAAIKAGDWKVDGACDPDSLLRHADAAIASLSAPQPPAEAHEDEVVCLECGQPTMPMGQVCYACSHPDTAPPSAPVGVEDESVRVGNLPTMNQDGYPGLGEWWVQLWRGDEIIARVYGDGPDEVRSQAQDIADALNQQPAAGVGEEIMVNAAHDVYTLPLQPSGLSSGPRFVVHVPAPEKPAAVDESFVERFCGRWYQLTGRSLDRPSVRACLTEALAAQQGGES